MTQFLPIPFGTTAERNALTITSGNALFFNTDTGILEHTTNNGGAWAASPDTDGTQATGTWPINIGGNAATATASPPSGPAGGVLGGNYPNPTLVTAYLPLSGGTMTGSLILNADATVALQAVTYQQLMAAVVGVYKLQGGYNPAITSLYPTAANTTNPVSATVTQGMVWQITNNGFINGIKVIPGDQLVALINNPGQLDANWSILENNLGYTPLNQALNSGNIFVGNASNIAVGVVQSGDVTIDNAGVTALAVVNANVGSFGSASQVGVFTVNAKGLITAASNVTITPAAIGAPTTTGTGASGTWGISITGSAASAPPSGVAGGDLGNSYPNPTVSKINGVTLGLTTATTGNILIADGFQWNTTALSGDGTLVSGGVLTVTKTNGVAFAASATTDTTNAANISSGLLPIPRLSGTYGISISGNAATVSTIPSLTGDVSNSGNNTTVVRINGAILSTTTATSGNLLVANGAQWVTQAMSGDATIVASGAITVTKTSGVVFAASATTDTTNAANISSGLLPIPRLSGTYGISINGNSATTTTIPSLAGDVSNTANTVTVTRINGAILGATTATSGNILVASGAQWVTNPVSGDATLSSAGVVAVTKINGVALGSTTATAGNLLVGSGSSWVTQALSGAGTLSSAGVLTVHGRLLAIQVITVTGTYTPTAGAVTALVYAVGGGGGGGGSGTNGTPGGNGGTGVSTAFGAIMTVTGGAGGLGGGGNPGAGSSVGGVGSGTVNFTGSSGGNGAGTGGDSVGGNGGASSVGGTGIGAPAGAVASGGTAPANSGGGGGGASGSGGSVNAGGGGAAGGTGIVLTPAISTSVTVGNGGTAGIAGASGASAGNGARGIIYIFEYS